MSNAIVGKRTEVSHWLTTGTHSVHDGRKEEVRITFDATWRGEPCVLRMTASRYVHSSGWSDWTVYTEDAKRDGGVWGEYLSETAYTRLGDAARPLVQEWLKSDEYTESERVAYYYAIRGQAHDLRPYGTVPTMVMRRNMERYADKLTPAMQDRLTRLCDAFDAYAKVYGEEGVPT